MSVAEAPGGLAAADAAARWSDIQRRADDLAQTLYALREEVPQHSPDGARIADTLASLQAVRSAMDAERAPGGASLEQADVVRSRLAPSSPPCAHSRLLPSNCHGLAASGERRRTASSRSGTVGDGSSHRELAPGMTGNMIAEMTRGIRADDVSSRLAGGRDHARDQMIRSRLAGVAS